MIYCYLRDTDCLIFLLSISVTQNYLTTENPLDVLNQTTEHQMETTEIHLPNTESLLLSTEGQMQTTEIHLPNTESLLLTTKGQLQTTEGPLQTTEGPLQTTEGPLQTTVAPLQTTEGIIQTTAVPFQSCEDPGITETGVYLLTAPGGTTEMGFCGVSGSDRYRVSICTIQNVNVFTLKFATQTGRLWLFPAAIHITICISKKL